MDYPVSANGAVLTNARSGTPRHSTSGSGLGEGIRGGRGMNYKSSAHGWCTFDAQLDDARIREVRKDASRLLITFDGASDTQEVEIRDKFRKVVLSGPWEKRTQGDTLIRENVEAMPVAHSNGLGVYTDGSTLQNGTSGNDRGKYDSGGGGRANGGRVNGGRPNGSHPNGGRPNGSHPTVSHSNGGHPNVGHSNGSRSNGSGINRGGFGINRGGLGISRGGLGINRGGWSQQAGRSDSPAVRMAGSPDSTSLPDPPASPTMTVAEWEKEDEDIAELSLAGLSLGAPARFGHEAEDLIDMAYDSND